jgi:hypothetical protein
MNAHCPDDHMLLWHALDLGVDEDSRDPGIVRHVAGCADCRSRFEAPAEDLPGFGHVPPAILVSWPRMRDRLASGTAEAVDRHLGWCGDCREDLERLARIRSLPRARSLTLRSRPLLAASGAVAAVLAVVFALRSPTAPPAPRARNSMPAPAATAGPAIAPWTIRMAAGSAVRLEPMRRGSADPVVFGSGAPLRIRVEPLFDVSPASPIALELRDANGVLRARSSAPWSAFHGGATIEIARAGKALPTGRYVVRLCTLPPAAADAVDYPLRIR